jgi:predicted transcriptional regulator
MIDMKNAFDARVSDWMVSPVRTLDQGTRLTEAARQLDVLGVSALPVLDSSSRLSGVFSRSDLLLAGRFMLETSERPRYLRLPDSCVADFMKTRVSVTRRQVSLAACARRMHKQNLHRLYVAEDGPLEGVVSTREMLSAVARAGIETPLSQLLQRAIGIVSVRDPLASAMARLRANSALTLVVTDSERPVGVFSRADAVISREADPTEAVALWMDPNVVCLPADLPAHRGAQGLYEAKGRYVVACEGGSAVGTISGLGFTELVAANACS